MKIWTKEETDLLRDLVKKDKSYKVIAALLGRSYFCVGTKAKRLGITQERGSEEARETAVRRDTARNRKPLVKQPFGGKPCPPPSLDLMHNGNYVPAKPYCARDGALDAFDLPSGRGTAAIYRDHSHP